MVLFRHFDKDKSGRLDHHEFKSCLRALGYDLPMVEEGQRDPEFEAILDSVDPNRYGLQHFEAANRNVNSPLCVKSSNFLVSEHSIAGVEENV